MSLCFAYNTPNIPGRIGNSNGCQRQQELGHQKLRVGGKLQQFFESVDFFEPCEYII